MHRYLAEFAHEDKPVPIEEEQTFSQPSIVAFMIEALEPEGSERVLEIGTGSGYAEAVLEGLTVSGRMEVMSLSGCRTPD